MPIFDSDAPMGPSRMALSKPVIAAMSGHAVAGGLELALWCDLRVVESDAVFGVFCRRWGVPLIDGGTVRLPQIVGLGRALDLILTGRAVEADEALAIGLATRVVEPGQARAEAEALAAQLAELPQDCLRSDRRSVYDALGSDARTALASEFAHGQRVIAGALAGAQRFAAGAGRHGDLRHCLDGDGLLFEHARELLAQLRGVLVPVHGHCVLGRGTDHLVALAGDRQRAVALARILAAVSHVAHLFLLRRAGGRTNGSTFAPAGKPAVAHSVRVRTSPARGIRPTAA